MSLLRVLFVLLISFTFSASAQNVRPSRAQALDTLHKLKAAFKNAPNDSIFITQYSDNVFKYYNFTIGDQPEDIEEHIYNAKVGDVVGPFQGADSSNYIFKILSFKDYTTRCRARLIYIRPNKESKKDTSSVRKITNKYLELLKKGEDIEHLGHKEDVRVVLKDLKWFYENQSEKDKKEFHDKVFSMKKGEAIIVNTDKGVAILHVTNSKERIPFFTRLVAVVKKG